MPHPRVESYRSRYRAQAQTIRAQLERAERAQHSNRELTATQRRRNLQHLRDQAARQLTQLRVDFANGRPGLLKSIRAPLYRLPPRTAAVLEWRDAMREAAAISDQADALMLWERAALVGDQVGMLALAYLAAPNPETEPPRWQAIIERWKASDPAVAEVLDAYDQAHAELLDDTAALQDATMFELPAPVRPADSGRLPRLTDHHPEPA